MVDEGSKHLEIAAFLESAKFLAMVEAGPSTGLLSAARSTRQVFSMKSSQSLGKGGYQTGESPGLPSTSFFLGNLILKHRDSK